MPGNIPWGFCMGLVSPPEHGRAPPDGREGFQNLFLRRGYSVYLVDQPQRGDAGRSTVSMNVGATPDEQFWFGQFRMGLWPNFFENTQFASGEKALAQFMALTRIPIIYCGDTTVIHLPEAGLTGNTHFPFSDLNNEKVAEHLANWLYKKRLD